MRWILAVLLVLASVSSVAAQINIGINFGSLPRLVIVPDTPVSYAPDVDANFFRYGNQYWVFKDNDWYVGRGYRGPWSRVEAERVPTPLLRVPVRYYRATPPQWHERAQQAAHHPPAWDPHYGKQWDHDHYKPAPPPKHEEKHEQKQQAKENHGQGQGQGHQGEKREGR